MDNSLITIIYKTADGSEICVEVSAPVKDFLEQSDRQIRSQRRQDRRYVDYMDFTDGFTQPNISNPQPDIACLLIKMERYEHLYSAFRQLTKIQRQRLQLHFVQNLSYSQIAEIEGVHLAAVSRSIKLAINKLQKLLAE